MNATNDLILNILKILGIKIQTTKKPLQKIQRGLNIFIRSLN